jgi:diguanylate cyclase (GGDEF)-like protein/PAS domain S-box-containing protein
VSGPRSRSARPRAIARARREDAFAREAQRYFDAAFDNAPIGMALFNCAGEYVRVNASLCALLGRSSDDLIGRRDQELTHPEDRASDLVAAERIFAGELSTHQTEKRFVRPDGSIVWALANLTFLRDEAGRPLGWVGQFQDITARREAEERFRLAFDHAPIGIALVAPEGRFLRVNGTLCEMLGYDEAELLSVTFQDITHPEDLDADLEHVQAMLAGDIRTYEMDKRYIRADGSIMWVLLSVSLVRDDADHPRYFISQIQDIDERKQAQGELEHLANHDPLTGALNRRAWDRELARAIAEAARLDRTVTIALIDLDDFKQLNDTHGHDAGDRALADAACWWRSQLRSADLLARVGGDEFAVLLADCDREHLDAIVRRLKKPRPNAPLCSIGLATWRQGECAATLMRRADQALYAEKIGARDQLGLKRAS